MLPRRKYKLRTSTNEEQQQNEDQKSNEEQQHHSNLTGVSPKQSNIARSFCLLIKKIITEVLLILLLYLILLFTWWQFRYVIKIMADLGDILNDDWFFGDIVDTPKEGIEQHKIREELQTRVS